MRLFRRSKPSDSTSHGPGEKLVNDYVPGDDYAPRWYVPHHGNDQRFIGADGFPTLHLIVYTDTTAETVLRLCGDSTGLLVRPTDRRLPYASVYVSQLRGEYYHQAACQTGDFSPGQPVRLVREPTNEFDRNAVAVYDVTGAHLAAYVNKQKARLLARLIDGGEVLTAISIRGTRPGVECEQIAILAAQPAVLSRLREPRPPHLPAPAHLR